MSNDERIYWQGVIMFAECQAKATDDYVETTTRNLKEAQVRLEVQREVVATLRKRAAALGYRDA